MASFGTPPSPSSPLAPPMSAYIASALDAQAQGRELPFVIIRKPSGQVVASIRFFQIERTPARRNRIHLGSRECPMHRSECRSQAVAPHPRLERLRCIRVEFTARVLIASISEEPDAGKPDAGICAVPQVAGSPTAMAYRTLCNLVVTFSKKTHIDMRVRKMRSDTNSH